MIKYKVFWSIGVVVADHIKDSLSLHENDLSCSYGKVTMRNWQSSWRLLGTLYTAGYCCSCWCTSRFLIVDVLWDEVGYVSILTSAMLLYFITNDVITCLIFKDSYEGVFCDDLFELDEMPMHWCEVTSYSCWNIVITRRKILTEGVEAKEIYVKEFIGE